MGNQRLDADSYFQAADANLDKLDRLQQQRMNEIAEGRKPRDGGYNSDSVQSIFEPFTEGSEASQISEQANMQNTGGKTIYAETTREFIWKTLKALGFNEDGSMQKAVENFIIDLRKRNKVV